LVDISTWADEIKRRPEYRFSSRLHYSNPQDDEPNTCSYSYKHDCPEGQCVVGAILNYTSRLSPKNPRSVRVEALKFLVHFIGDIHQPLHVSGRDRGGNSAKVRFFGSKSNLHSVWDGLILGKRFKEGFDQSFDRFLTHLLTRIDSQWSAESESWAACPAPNRFIIQQDVESKDDYKNPVCPEAWAVSANRLNCKKVWVGYYDNVDLRDEYFDSTYGVVEQQLAMGGMRLALVLNHILN